MNKIISESDMYQLKVILQNIQDLKSIEKIEQIISIIDN